MAGKSGTASTAQQQLAFSLLEKLRPVFSSFEEDVYLVGGAVRDLFLQRPIRDLDFAVPREGLRLTFQVADKLGYPAYVLDRERNVGRVVLPDLGATIDIAAFRASSLEEDLELRDFTINAMAMPAGAYQNLDVIDHFNGLRDLQRKTVQITRDDSIESDSVRALRAVRLAVDLNFSLLPKTADSIMTYGYLLEIVSRERVRDELLKILDSKKSSKGLALLRDLKLLEFIFPGSRYSGEYHDDFLKVNLEKLIATIRTLENMANAITGPSTPVNDENSQYWPAVEEYAEDLATYFSRIKDGGVSELSLLKLSTLLIALDPGGGVVSFSRTGNCSLENMSHSVKLQFKQIDTLKLSREATVFLKAVIRGHRTILPLTQEKLLTRRDIYRYFQNNDPAGIDIIWLTIAAANAGALDRSDPTRYLILLSAAKELFNCYFRLFDRVVRPVPLINGAEIMAETGLETGPEIGRLLALVEEYQAAGEITTREQALKYVGRRMRSSKPKGV